MSSVLAVAADPDRGDPITARFWVEARAEAGVMPRILELFAKRGLLPQQWHSVVTGAAGLSIAIEVAALGREAADYVARCMRQVVGVDTVVTAIAPAAAASE